MAKNKGGRPKIEIDLKQVEALAGLQCTDEEIAAVLGVSTDTVGRRKQEEGSSFVEVYNRGKEKGKASLRRYQWESAKKAPRWEPLLSTHKPDFHFRIADVQFR